MRHRDQFPLFSEYNKRPPNRDELQFALRVHEYVLRLITREFIRYDEAFGIVTQKISQHDWFIARYLGFDARPKASTMPNATGKQAIFQDRSATRQACKVLEEAMNAAPITLRVLRLDKETFQ